jgi:putative inorganic carbon (hco3(-)) transporter
VIWTLLAAGIFLGSLSVFQYVTGTFDENYGGFARAEFKGIAGDDRGYRLAGPIGDANFFAQIMIVLIPIALERMLHERKLALKILAGLAGVLCILTVIFTFSRGGFLAAAVALLIFFLVYPPRPLYLILLIGLGTVVFSLTPSSYFDRILTLQGLVPDQSGRIDIRSDNSIQGRASQNLTAWSIFKQHPVVGIGLDNFEVRYPEFSKEIGLAPSASNKSLHNLYFEVATETGILGLSVFFLMISLSIRSILNARSAFLEIPGYQEYAHIATGLVIGFAGYLVAALFIHAAFPRYFYLLVGIAFSLPAIVGQARSTLKTSVIKA